MLLSVLMPIYNEKNTLDDILDRVLAVALPAGVEGLEIVAVDDGSSDGTRDVLKRRAASDPRIRVILHDQNQGKGAAIRTAIREARGDIAIFQDADLEYDPNDYARLLRPILEKGADVVYGSRFAASEFRRVLFFWHSVGNRLLTTVSNMLNDLNLTDMETCYKMFRMSVLKTLPIRSNGFGIEPEITAKVAKRKLTIFEVPVSYAGRTYAEGKKIGMKDGFVAVWTMIKYKVVDDLYEERYGEAILRDMELATRFTAWLSKRLDPYLTGTVLEVGAGIGNNVRALLHKEKVIATEPDLEYVRLLRNAFGGRRNVEVRQWDVTESRQQTTDYRPQTMDCRRQSPDEGQETDINVGAALRSGESSVLSFSSPLRRAAPTFESAVCSLQSAVSSTLPRSDVCGLMSVVSSPAPRSAVCSLLSAVCSPLPPVDSILCSNVLEHIENEHAALRNMHAALKPGGRLVLVVPAGKWLHGSMDKVLGHWRRYSKTEVVKQLSGEGFDVETVFSMNKPGVLGWFMNGKVFHRKTLGKFQMKLFNALVPVFRRLDPILPWTGLSLVVVARKREEGSGKR